MRDLYPFLMIFVCEILSKHTGHHNVLYSSSNKDYLKLHLDIIIIV